MSSTSPRSRRTRRISIFARVVTKLREHLEKRDLGVKHVVVFVDELNKYAPSDGQDTYVRKMLLDIAERGRYLGLVLFSAQQFRSQVHRRVVGNSGTALYGRMDADELATPGYAVLSPAVKTKLATLEKGQLMVRHPHFTQPIFVRFPRPAVMRGRDGAERYPQAQDVDARGGGAALAAAARSDDHAELGAETSSTCTSDDDGDSRAQRDDARAPGGREAFFQSQLAPIVPSTAGRPTGVTPLRSAPADDPYDSESRCPAFGFVARRSCSVSIICLTKPSVSRAQAVLLQIRPASAIHCICGSISRRK